MADFAALADTLLSADGTFSGLMTGGIYTYADTGALGISERSTPAAFSDTTGALLPCCVLKNRAAVPFGGLHDVTTVYASYRQVLEVWLYADAAAGYSTLETARLRAHVLLNEAQLTGSFNVAWVNGLNDMRDEALQNACFVRDDYQVYSYRSS